MSSSSTVGQSSRSPSPLTPEPTDAVDPIAIQSDPDQAPSWFHAMQSAKPSVATWHPAQTAFSKPEDEDMLRLDELIEQHAYDDAPAVGFSDLALRYPSPPSSCPVTSSSSPAAEPIVPDFRSTNLLVPSLHGPISITKPVPPPAPQPRKQDPSSMNQRVVYPPKESCHNLPIHFPSIPEGGTKSRVETQVRVTVDLADGASSDSFKYDRVGTWKWLKLPQGTATKRRTRKQGKIDPDPEDILHLSATVTCASPPHNRVLSCSSCQAREAKRVAKKLAARVRPARSESDSEGDGTKLFKGKQHEDTTSIIQFNCAEVLDFSTGSVVLPLRITCYCRHHREKVGFNVHFSFADCSGRVIASGMSRPIMITDDHKTSTKMQEMVSSFTPIEHHDWSPVTGIMNDGSATGDSRAPSRRKKEFLSTTKKRAKPYDASTKPNRLSPDTSVSNAPSPSSLHSPLPLTRASTPSSALQSIFETAHPPPLHHGLNGSETSSPDTLTTPLDHHADILMPDTPFTVPIHQNDLTPNSTINPSNMLLNPLSHPLPFMLFGSTQSQQTLTLQLPTIHRLIPSVGPTHGGIEVTVLGANFHPSIPLNCVFGDVSASSTQRWSDNTLVCVLPPRATAGVVAVWFEGFPKADEQTSAPPSLFTYSDESDRALMELALQVVGLKMTGKIEDAKNVAMRIVGTAGGSDGADSQSGNAGGLMQLSTSTSYDLRPLINGRSTGGQDFENSLVDFLSILDTPLGDDAPDAIVITDAISYPSSSGQTLLHLAAFLGFTSLSTFLVRHGADVDARDRNGFTPLHFAVLSRSATCAKILVDAGADLEIVNSHGKTAQEIADPVLFGDLFPPSVDVDSTVEWSEDDEADLGDVEDDDDVLTRKILRRRLSRHTSRSNLLHSGKGTPRRSVDISRATTPPPAGLLDEKIAVAHADVKKRQESDAADAKRAASFMEMFQRTLAQFPAPGLPALPNLPGLPNLPWGALPQVPMVFPIFVPMGWPSFRTGEKGMKDGENDEVTKNMGAFAVRAAQEWRTTLENWMAATANTVPQDTEEMPPPEYTPRADGGETVPPPADLGEPVASTSTTRASEMRPVCYHTTPLPEQVVESFGYRPTAKQTRKMQKKHDRMLLLFWVPVLCLSLLWAFHNGLRLIFQTVKTVLPVRTPLRT